MDATQAVELVNEVMTLTPLGGGQEVGRSCILLKYKGRTILLDCGIHPGRDGVDAFPFFDIVDPAEVDLVLITHFHLDHCASLPYFTEKTNFKGRVFMTHATKAVMRLLVSDYVKLLAGSRVTNALYTDKDLINCIEKIEVVDFHHTITMEQHGIKFCAYSAGHVLGAAMFTVSIDGVVVLYTGDYSLEEDRHLMPAEVPPDKPDVLIVESTYGVALHSSREEREGRFTHTVDSIVRRGGNCLIPVFALGRAQELLLILDEYWTAMPDLHDVPIFYASRMANKALRVYQTFINMMNAHIRTLMDISNPFKFNYIKNMQESEFDGMGPCVVVASPGMLQNGVSRTLFEQWCDDPRNGVVLAGYSVEGTLAKKLLNEPEEITCLDGRIKPRKCSIEYISFTAHVDFMQNCKFIYSVVPDNIMLVHGEATEMSRLKTDLERNISRSWPETHIPPVVMPKNGQSVSVTFAKPTTGDAVGTVAKTLLADMESGSTSSLPSNTLLIKENFVSKLVTVEEMSEHTSCHMGKILQRLHIPIPREIQQLQEQYKVKPIDMVIQPLESVFDLVEQKAKESTVVVFVQNIVCVEAYIADTEDTPSVSLVVSWSGSPINDLVADTVIGILFQSLSATHFLRSMWSSGTKRECHKHPHDHTETDPEEQAMLKRMKCGLVDPSKAIPGIDSVLTTMEEHDISVDQLHRQYHAQNKEKLIWLRDMLIGKGVFHEVTLDNRGVRLIIRKKTENALIDAYCYIRWSKHAGHVSHSAVVQCNDNDLKGEIISVLKSISNSA